MDQLKVYLGHLKKHHFWVLTLLVLILTLVGWNSASSQLAGEFSTNKSKIESEFSSVNSIITQTNHPNESFEQEANRHIAELRSDVEAAWNYVYSEQKSKVLKWPPALGKDFVDWVNDPDHYTRDIPHSYRERYNNYVKQEFPRLLEIVDAKPYWEPDDMGGEAGSMAGRGIMPGRGAGPGRMPGRGPVGPPGAAVPVQPVKEYMVVWDKKDQQAIADSFDFATTPDSQTVRFCQENLWVYHALLDAIAKVNKGATGNHNAKIKEIISISIAHDAAANLIESLAHGRIVIPDGAPLTPLTPNYGPAPGAEGEEGAAPMMAQPPGMGDEEGGRGFGGGVATVGKITDHQRYLDEKGLPLATGTPGPAEFKRMPIVLRLKIDQREISDLLVTLANSPLPVDIRQVRINTKIPGYTNTAPSMFGGKDASTSSPGGGGRNVNVIKRDNNMEAAFQNPYDVGVELHGIIYIFNPPDKSLRTLGATGETTEVAAPAAPVPAEPAAETPAAPVEEPVAPQESPAEPAPAEPAPSEPAADPTAPPNEVNEFEQASPPAAPNPDAVESDLPPST